MKKTRKIEQMIEKAKTFLNKDFTSDNIEFKAWQAAMIRFLEEEYGEKSSIIKLFKNISYSLWYSTIETAHKEYVQAFEEGIQETIEHLKCLLDEAKEEENENKEEKNNQQKVFIVHGKNEAKKYELSGFLYEQGLKPTILHQEANGGNTIIEKIEENSDVACAIILLTPDDEGKLRDSTDELKTRARQNVIFEAGYFMGKLGRNRTILISGVEEAMSDISGIVYLDINNYQYDLLKELKKLKLIK